MPLDHYVTLGRSGLRVSPFCLGAMTFGEDWGFGTPVPESEAIMARYFERGGNFVDTANGYTGGHSERIIGNFIAHDQRLRCFPSGWSKQHKRQRGHCRHHGRYEPQRPARANFTQVRARRK